MPKVTLNGNRIILAKRGSTKSFTNSNGVAIPSDCLFADIINSGNSNHFKKGDRVCIKAKDAIEIPYETSMEYLCMDMAILYTISTDLELRDH